MYLFIYFNNSSCCFVVLPVVVVYLLYFSFYFYLVLFAVVGAVFLAVSVSCMISFICTRLWKFSVRWVWDTFSCLLSSCLHKIALCSLLNFSCIQPIRQMSLCALGRVPSVRCLVSAATFLGCTDFCEWWISLFWNLVVCSAAVMDYWDYEWTQMYVFPYIPTSCM